MKAVLLKQHRQRLPNGGLIEMKIWKLPCPVPPRDHEFKYRLVYVLEGKRVVGFDNERGKGDHKHLDGKQHAYRFVSMDIVSMDIVSMDQPLDDFLSEVARRVT